MALTDEKHVQAADDGIIDLNIDVIKKQKFRINGDPNAIIELNLSDLNITNRLEKGYKKLQEQMSKIAQIPNDDEKLSEKLAEANSVMCDWIDYIFDSPISAVVAKGGTMYDPYGGVFRFEHIIDNLTRLYTDNINEEYKKLKKRVQKHTDKYVGNKRTSRK